MFDCKSCKEKDSYIKQIETVITFAQELSKEKAAVLQSEIEYLKKMVDRLMVKNEMKPVDTKAFEEMLEKQDKSFEDDPEIVELKKKGAVFRGL